MGFSDAEKKESGDERSIPQFVKPPQQPKKDPNLGRVLGGRFRLDTVLYNDGLSTIYLAEDAQSHQKVVVKMLQTMRLEPKMRRHFSERFRREAMGMAHIAHPNIIDIVACDLYAEETPYIVMEHVDGVTLKDFVSQFERGLPLPTFIAFMEQICDAVSFMHDKGIIHRDIKPQNIMVLIEHGSFLLKLLDFGLIFFHHAVGPEEALKLTKKGDLVGTPIYMSPEQCTGGEVTLLSDIYNLGLIAYELLVGEPPFTAANLTGIIKKQVLDQPPALSDRRLGLSEELVLAVGRALDKEAEQRFPTCKVFFEALKKGVERSAD